MIGIIPAAGEAKRMDMLPKMLLPVPDGCLFSDTLRRMRLCNIERFVVGTRTQNLDLLDDYCDTNMVLFGADTATMSETVLRSREYIGENEVVALAMPDTFFDDESAFCKLQAALQKGADVAVGIFRVKPAQSHKLGMCECEGDSLISVIDKPNHTERKYAWGVLAWRPVYWQYIRESDPHVGYGLPYAIDAGVNVQCVRLDGEYWDCGTRDEYFDLVRHLT